ncbi:MAG: TIGR00159 family protein [Proteobacteria bacterium]|nr:TIGR00159 family protein [Pseudomonadota bacterium]
MPDFMSNLWNSPGGTVTAILDFVIVFYLVYITLLLIRGTRTVWMALGLLLIVVLYLLSRYFGLATTYMLLDQFMEVAIIFALIIFQDDIRRALVRMGRFAWFSRAQAKAQESHVVEEVVRSAVTLASKRIGAIMVFERDASLNEFTERGTNVDAEVTKELLYTFFIPRMENPLHDGAVIIKNYRVSEAGAILPLSVNPRIDKSLGTRHRAALGITEETDAVSVVVSEERGTISLCFGGLISKNLDMGSLRKAMHSLFSEEKTRERRKAAQERKSRPPPQHVDQSEDLEQLIPEPENPEAEDKLKETDDKKTSDDQPKDSGN